MWVPLEFASTGVRYIKLKVLTISAVYWQLEGKRQVDCFYHPQPRFLANFRKIKLRKSSGGLWKCVQPKITCWWGSSTDVFCGKLMSTPTRWNTLFTSFTPNFKMRCVCILTVTFRQDVSYNKKPKQTTALGKHTTSKLGKVVCLPWYWTQWTQIPTYLTNHHERVRTRRPYIEQELSSGELFTLKTPPSPRKKPLKLTNDIMKGLAFIKAKGFFKLVGNSNLNSTFHIQIVSKGFN